MMYCLLGMAFAFPTGTFFRIESAEQVKKDRKKALEQTLSASSFWVRGAARSRLEGKPYSCIQYKFESKSESLFVQCDDRQQIEIRLDGTPTIYKGKTHTMKVIAKVEGNTITQRFDVKKGGLKVVYTFLEGEVRVQKIIESSYLGKPLMLNNRYKIQR